MGWLSNTFQRMKAYNEQQVIEKVKKYESQYKPGQMFLSEIIAKMRKSAQGLSQDSPKLAEAVEQIIIFGYKHHSFENPYAFLPPAEVHLTIGLLREGSPERTKVEETHINILRLLAMSPLMAGCEAKAETADGTLGVEGEILVCPS